MPISAVDKPYNVPYGTAIDFMRCSKLEQIQTVEFVNQSIANCRVHQKIQSVSYCRARVPRIESISQTFFRQVNMWLSIWRYNIVVIGETNEQTNQINKKYTFFRQSPASDSNQ